MARYSMLWYSIVSMWYVMVWYAMAEDDAPSYDYMIMTLHNATCLVGNKCIVELSAS